MPPLLETLRELKLLRGRGKQKSLLQLCHASRLVGAMSVSLRATPDEVVAALAEAMGAKVKVLDVRGQRPMQLQLRLPDASEHWVEADDVTMLADALNEKLREVKGFKPCAVLGEHEDMLQLWCLPADALAEGLEDGWLWPTNARALVVIAS